MTTTILSARQLAEFLYQRPFRIASERMLQDDVERAFISEGIAYEREKRLSATDRVDFLVGRTALELKVKGQRRRHQAQIERYASHDCVDAVVLLTNVPMARSAVSTIGPMKKPCFYVFLGRSAL